LSGSTVTERNEGVVNADFLKRVVRAIAHGSPSDLHAVAARIVESERRIGHKRLAGELEAILKQRNGSEASDLSRLPPPRGLSQLPVGRRHSESLATLLQPESLEHHMVLPAKTEARFARIEREYAARERLGTHGLLPRKTILLFGPPGCGKSLGAKRLAWSTGLPLMKVRFDALISSYFGESAANLRILFQAAKERPSVLLLDECDFIARSRVNTKDVGEASRIVNSLLQLMEEYDAPGLLVATTNVESSLDHALFRRFDDVFLIPPPGPVEIERLLRETLSAVKCSEPMDWKQLSKQLGGAPAAMVVKAARDAAKAAVLSGRPVVTEALVLDAVADLHLRETAGN
jgi:ATPase family associated with various cellular activities (AAA)